MLNQLKYHRGVIAACILLYGLAWIVFRQAGKVEVLLEITIVIACVSLLGIVLTSAISQHSENRGFKKSSHDFLKIQILGMYVISLILVHGGKVFQGFSDTVDRDSLIGLILLPCFYLYAVRSEILYRIGIGFLFLIPFALMAEVSEDIIKRFTIHALFFIFYGICASFKDSKI